MKNTVLILMLLLASQALVAQVIFDCKGVKVTLKSQSSTSAELEVEVSHNHQVNPPGDRYAFFTLENGTCQNCSPLSGTRFPKKVTWTIAKQSGTTKLVPHPDRAGGCDLEGIVLGEAAGQKLVDESGKGVKQDLSVVAANQLGAQDVWVFEEVENGNVVLKCPTRGYLVAGAVNGTVVNLGYHQYKQTATRFQPNGSSGFITYKWVNNNPNHQQHYLGHHNWILKIKQGSGNALQLQ